MGKKILSVLAILFIGITAFHFLHHYLYCQYRTVPGKSHCGVCGHRKICAKVHFKKKTS